MQGLGEPPDASPVAAVALPTHAGLTRQAPQQRARSMWHEPEPWTVAIVLATTVVIAARHPLARMIGTEAADTGNLTAISVTSTAPPLTTPEIAAPVPLTPYRTHAPRDPFRPLADHHVKAAHPARTTTPATPAHRRVTGGSTKQGAKNCAGGEHQVVAGDTLWSVAARAVHSTDPSKVQVAWRRIYDANRGSIGADPSLLRVGTTLCLG